MRAHQAISTYRSRAWYLPPSGQTYIPLPNIRPDRGTCPSCGVAEDRFCDLTCGLDDPYAFNMVHLMSRCWHCDRLVSFDDEGPHLVEVLVIPDSPVRHYSLGARSRCGLVSKPKAHGYTVRW